MKTFNKKTVTKTIALINPVNNELWYCDDYTKVKNIDGEDFINVYKPQNINRSFLMKKNALKIVDKNKL